jgi:hypothetical protein
MELLLRSSSTIPHIDYSAQDQSIYLTRNSDACGFCDLARALYRLVAGDAREPKVPSVCDTHAALHCCTGLVQRFLVSHGKDPPKNKGSAALPSCSAGTSVDEARSISTFWLEAGSIHLTTAVRRTTTHCSLLGLGPFEDADVMKVDTRALFTEKLYW